MFRNYKLFALALHALSLAGILAGCVSYEPRPLDAREELATLNARDVPFDPTDGLSEDEAVAVALALNPDLEAARAGIGLSTALLVGAKVYPNPELGVAWRGGVGGTPGFTVESDLLFELLRPAERKSRIAIAEAHADASRAAVIAQEYELAAAVRRQVFAVLVEEHTTSFMDAEAVLRERAVALVGQRQAVGEANQLDVSATQMELLEVQRDRRLAGVKLQESRRELGRLMGLPPGYSIRLADSGKPLTPATPEDPTDEQIQERIVASRLDLRSKEAEYRIAEEELRLEVTRQYPRLRIGPSYSHEGETDNSIGLGVALELPVLDRNQGGIAEKLATRDRIRAEYAALLHGLRAAAEAARAGLRAARAEVATQERDVLPLLQHIEELSRAAFEARELTVLEWVATQQRALRTRRAYLDSLVAYRSAAIDLDTALGLSGLTDGKKE